MRTWMRRPALLLVVAFLMVALVAGFTFANNRTSRAHAAAATPTITVSAHTVHPRQKVTITGQGFAPNDTMFVYLDQLDNSFGNLACDGTGNCSGSVTIPATSPQGQHMVLAQGSQPGGAVANAPIILSPAIFFAQYVPTHGGPGTGTIVIGFAFQPNEIVNVYWGGATGTLLGTVTSDPYSGSFSFPFVVAAHVAPGKYPITVVRSGQKPATVATTFTVVPPAVTAAGGVRGGQVLRFHLSGFQADENVAISWNANDGQQIGVIRTDSSGFFSSPGIGEVFVPPTPLGSYTLTFTGESSGSQVSAPLNIGPGIQASAVNNPGGTIPVSGGGFRSRETLTVFIEGYKKATSVPVTTVADGSFQTNLIAPLSLTPGPIYHMVATNSDGSEKATAFFSIYPPSITWASADVNNETNIAAYGSAGTISGYEFPANEQVTLYWNYQQAGQVVVGMVQAAADGLFSFNLNTPSSPFTSDATIEAIASTSTFTASFQVQPQPAVSVNPVSVPVGHTVSISGGSFGGNATVTIQLAGSTTTALVASDGTFTTPFTIPSNTQGGPSGVFASDGTVNANTTVVIDVELNITPTTGNSGTSINAQSPNFSNSGNNLLCFLEQPYIAWYDPTTGTSQNIASACMFPETITAPTNLVSGRTYEVELNVGGYVIGQAAFTAR